VITDYNSGVRGGRHGERRAMAGVDMFMAPGCESADDLNRSRPRPAGLGRARRRRRVAHLEREVPGRQLLHDDSDLYSRPDVDQRRRQRRAPQGGRAGGRAVARPPAEQQHGASHRSRPPRCSSEGAGRTTSATQCGGWTISVARGHRERHDRHDDPAGHRRYADGGVAARSPPRWRMPTWRSSC
jgi:hypothetical protein